MPVLMDARGKITEGGGPYAGIDRFERESGWSPISSRRLFLASEDYEVPLLVERKERGADRAAIERTVFADQRSSPRPR